VSAEAFCSQRVVSASAQYGHVFGSAHAFGRSSSPPSYFLMWRVAGWFQCDLAMFRW
jgi:hypothetical protein